MAPLRKRKASDEHISQARRYSKYDPVKVANRLDLETFKDRYCNELDMLWTTPDNQFRIEHHAAKTIPSVDFEQCFELIDTTSRNNYEGSTVGWNPKHKKKEMRDEAMHYLVVREACQDEATAKLVKAFCSFMLTYDSLPCVPVLYIYEIHLAEVMRRTGLGTRLMSLCETVAQNVGVEKVMLTCFVSNVHAQRFYAQRGFSKDAVSPEDRQIRNKLVQVDILILSKSVEHPEVDQS